MSSIFLGYNISLGQGLAFGATTHVLSNAGLLSLNGEKGAFNIVAGSNISLSTTSGGLTINNTYSYTLPSTVLTSSSTYVKTLQGSSGALDLAAGTGIGISGLTISNTGIISASAGAGISVSGTNPLTITNTGVTSFQGDTGAISLTAGTGIGISSLTISNTGVTSLSAGTGISLSGSTGGVTITNTGIISLTAGNGISVSGSSIAMSGSYSGNLTISGNYLGDNYEINGGYRFWGNDSNGVVMFLGADAYSGYGDQILDFGVNTNQQTNSGGLPSPTASYGGGLFRFDLRSGNPSGLSTLGSATGNAEFYILLQPSGTVGDGNSMFGVSANGIVGTINNILDNGSGGMSVAGSLTIGGNPAGAFSYTTINTSNTPSPSTLSAPHGVLIFGTAGGLAMFNSSGVQYTWSYTTGNIWVYMGGVSGGSYLYNNSLTSTATYLVIKF